LYPTVGLGVVGGRVGGGAGLPVGGGEVGVLGVML